MKKRRIVVTGFGIVSCFGTDVEHFYDQLLAGKSGVKKIDQFPCEEFSTRFAACIEELDVGSYMDKKQARRVDPFLRYSTVAGKKALEYAKVDLQTIDKDRCGVIVSSGMGGMQTFSDGVETIINKGIKRLTPFFVPYIITNMGGALLGIDLGFTGPNYSISTACATANYSIQKAAEEIQNHHADLMICGGVEAPMNKIGVGGFVACKALSTRNEEPTKASRPWDKDRDGFVMGEGCGVLVLEELEHAKKRGATIYAEYLGGANNCDAYHMTAPRADGKGVAQCMELALKDAGVEKNRVNYVNAHATSTLVGDLCEIEALRNVFKDQIYELKINATKSMIGHCLGAAGGMEAIATIMGIYRKRLHPTINVENPEEAVQDLDLILNRPIDFDVDVAITNSFGFGGHNCVLVFAPYKESL